MTAISIKLTFRQLKILGGTKNIIDQSEHQVRSNGSRGVVLLSSSRRRLIKKINKYDMIYKMYVKGEDRFTSENPLGVPI